MLQGVLSSLEPSWLQSAREISYIEQCRSLTSGSLETTGKHLQSPELDRREIKSPAPSPPASTRFESPGYRCTFGAAHWLRRAGAVACLCRSRRPARPCVSGSPCGKSPDKDHIWYVTCWHCPKLGNTLKKVDGGIFSLARLKAEERALPHISSAAKKAHLGSVPDGFRGTKCRLVPCMSGKMLGQADRTLGCPCRTPW